MALKQHPMDKDKKSGKENTYVNKEATVCDYHVEQQMRNFRT